MNFKILLVEDNEAHAILIKRCLARNKITNTIYHVLNGEEAIDFLYKKGKFIGKKYSELPNLILLDLRLPKMDGLSVLKEIKNKNKIKNIPVVILSTSDAESDIKSAYENNANSYLTKPVDHTKFLEMMKSFGNYWKIWNKNI